MDRKVIKGGEVLYTDGINTVYEVLSGEVLVFLVPIKKSGSGRRLLLGSFKKGEALPGFVHSTEIYGNWKTLLTAVDRSELKITTEGANEELLFAFAERARLPMIKRKRFEPLEETGIRDEVREQFEESVIEKYNRYEVKQDGYIYANIREKEYTKERTLRTILNAFIHSGSRSRTQIQESGNSLYDATALLCQRENIDIAPIERIEESSGHRFDINDISRVSHFVVREIVLEGNWYKKDCGAFLAFSDNNKPLAMIPRGPLKYVCYDPKTGVYSKVTRKLAGELLPNAYMLYRPFPNKALGIKDLITFGMKKVYTSDLIRIVVMALLGVLLGMLIPYINQQSYDRFIPMGNSSGLTSLGVLLLACGLGNISFTIVKNLAIFRSMNTIEYAVQSAVLDRLFNLPESFYRNYDAAGLGIKAMQITAVFSALGSGAVSAVLSVIFSLMYLFQMFKYSKDMSIAAIIMLLIVIAIITAIGLHQIKYEREVIKLDAQSQSQLFQTIKGISKLRMAGAEERALQRYIEKLVDAQKLNDSKENHTYITSALIAGVQILFSLVFYFMMIRKNIELSVGAFSAFNAAFGSFSSAMFTLTQEFLTVNHIKPAIEEAKPILETLPENPDDAGMPGDIEGEIEISSVTFGYDKEQEPVLRDFTLHVEPGENVGIVGSSGCGKSTLLKLLLGFEKPQIGKIYYDNQDIDGLDKRELRKKFGVVLQDGGLISGSIYENITITAPGVKMERVDETVRDVGLEDDIKGMPMGLHTVVSEEAGTISGGQRQRILIARAIVGKPKVIFLDEATSALDNATQSQVVNTLERLNATKIVIAHRISTVMNCDRIIVMDKGRIKESGNYHELMEQKGLFYELAVRQIS
ncbi:MAG: NHLP bacteriocin export ABC transporter permease/ATPase subunit [Lachnospiraceae bacterium]|nr:NHLP bacteriocin export ABC transporter permease/ATPase subunit [Lachnospiraceae bacterium]